MNIGRKLIRLADGAVNLAVLSVFLLFLSYGCYAVWDSGQLYAAADNTQYEIFKPDSKNSLPFETLQKMNPEVFGWLTVYGTNIDYPLVQGKDNDKYINTAADGSYALSGSLFLDYRNRNDFSDYNSIIYGHHMEGRVMFGEISDFREKDYFDSHRYGMICYSGEKRGIEFIAFLEIDAYNALYRPGISDSGEQEAYLEEIKKNARNYREFTAAEGQRLVLLSTCASYITNGRHVLVGRITDEVQEDPFYREPEEKHLPGIDAKDTLWNCLQKLPQQSAVLLLLILIISEAFLVTGICRRNRKNHDRRRKNV